MAKNCVTLEVSNDGVEGGGGDDEIELSLGLSIGRSYKKKSNGSSALERDSTNSCSLGGYFGPEGVVDSQSKRLRRREARTKQEEKMKNAENGGICDGEAEGNGDGFLVAEPARKKGKTDEMCGSDEERSDLGLALNRNQNPASDMTSFGVSSPVIPVLVPPPLQYQYPPMQYVPAFTSGFVYPQMKYVAPWLAAAAGGYQEACRPYQGNRENNAAAKNGLGDEKTISVGSPNCSSSAVSDYQSSSQQGGNNSDSRSMSSHSHQEQQANASAASSPPPTPPPRSLAEPSGSTNQVASNEAIEKSATHTLKLASSSIPAQASFLNSIDGPKPETLTDPDNNETLISQRPKAQNSAIGKPTTETGGTVASLPQTPCVSTTGNGPNGKTITGFLYRYTNAEVTIVCVCHGSSFSPAEFVEHAGGVNITHPLRHITVVHSNFGC